MLHTVRDELLHPICVDELSHPICSERPAYSASILPTLASMLHAVWDELLHPICVNKLLHSIRLEMPVHSASMLPTVRDKLLHPIYVDELLHLHFLSDPRDRIFVITFGPSTLPFLSVCRKGSLFSLSTPKHYTSYQSLTKEFQPYFQPLNISYQSLAK